MAGLSPSDYPEYAQFIANKRGSILGYGTKPALLLVDVCKAYFTPGPLNINSYANAASAPNSIKTLIAAAHVGGCPVIWGKTNYMHSNLRDAGLLAIKTPSLDVFREGDPRGLNDFLDGFEPREEDIIIHKKCPSAFFGTNLLTQLHVLGVDTLIIGGFCTSGSVRATALDSMQSGVRTMVVASACGDKTRETHFSNLFDINAKYGDVVSGDEAVERLEAGW